MRRGSNIYGRFWPLVLILLLSLSGCLQQNLVEDDSSAMHWLEDVSGTMTLDDVRGKDASTQWNKALKSSPNHGFIDSAVWLSLPFENTNDMPTAMLLEIAFPLHDSIHVYLLDGDEVVTSYHAGDRLPFVDRPLSHRNFLFPYTSPPNKKLQAFVRVESTDAMYLPVKVWEANKFFSKDQDHVVLLGLFFGFLSIMMFYNLFLYFSTRDKSYLYYVCYTASITYLQLTQKGLGYQYFWPEGITFNHLSVPLTNYVVMVSSLLFILNFLELDERRHNNIILIFSKLTWLAFLGLLGTSIILIPDTYIIPYPTLLVVTVVLGIATTLTVMSVLLRLSLQGNRSAQILSIAWLSLLIGICLFGLGRIGAPIPMLLSENAMLIGSTLEAALISFALARNIKRERDGRMKAQQLALVNERKTFEAQNSLLKLQEKTTQQLEQEVKERTQKLESAMQSLTAANQQLDNLARMDGLTGLSNRRNFDQAFDAAWRRDLRHQQPISLLMADIDHFKKINDTYGHLFGDQCLMRVANILKKSVGRPDDLPARFGGEEFIIMLPNTDAKRASQIAEGIRYSIQQLRIKHESEQIKFTISIGVATVVPTKGMRGSSLSEGADQALYQAKEGGRNCVVLNSDPILSVT